TRPTGAGRTRRVPGSRSTTVLFATWRRRTTTSTGRRRSGRRSPTSCAITWSLSPIPTSSATWTTRWTRISNVTTVSRSIRGSTARVSPWVTDCTRSRTKSSRSTRSARKPRTWTSNSNGGAGACPGRRRMPTWCSSRSTTSLIHPCSTRSCSRARRVRGRHCARSGRAARRASRRWPSRRSRSGWTGRTEPANLSGMSSSSTRQTPWALVFDAPFFLEDHFPRITADAEARGDPVADASSLLALPAGRALLDAVLPDDVRGPAAAPGRAASGASAFVVDRYAALLFAAYRFWRDEAAEHACDEATVRALPEQGTLPADWSLTQAPASGYVILPRNLVWSRVDGSAPAEPLDGFYWVHGGDELTVVAALGVRAERGGFSVLDA